MARSRRNDNPVNLFPFLAVLMCTMGALIFLLIVISKSIKEDAIAEAKGPAPQSDSRTVNEPEPVTAQIDLPIASIDERPLPEPLPIPEPLPKTLPDAKSFVSTVSSVEDTKEPAGPTFEEIQRQLASLANVQDNLEKQLSEKQDQIRLLEDEITRTRKEAQLAKAQSDDVEGQFQASLARVKSKELELAEAKADRKRLVRLINESNELVAMKQNENAQASSEFVIVPYDGETGTTRRPIILDCTDDAIRLVGEDIELTPGQLVGYTPGINPLKSGVKELVRFWATHDRTPDAPKQAKVPYVLLIVRPSGTVAFYVARKYLHDLGADFGYELVEEDFKFASEKSPEQAADLCRAAILQTLRLRRSSPGQQVASFLQSLEADNQRLRNARGGATNGSGGSFNDLTDSGKAMDRWDSRDVARRGVRASQGFFESNDFQNRGTGTTGVIGQPSGNGRGTFPSGQRPSNRLNTAGSGLPRGGIGNARGENRNNENIRGNGQSNRGTSASKDTSIGTGDSRPGQNPFLANGRSNQDGNIPNLLTRRNINGPDNSQVDQNGPGARGESRSADRGDNGAIDRANRRSNQANSSPLQIGNSNRTGQETNRSPFEKGGAGDPRSGVQGMNSRANGQLSNTQASRAGQSGGPSGAAAQPIEALANGAQAGVSQSTQTTTSLNPNRPSKRSAAQPSLQLNPSRNRIAHFKRQWGVQNPTGSIALEKTMIIRMNAQKVVIGDKLQIRITEDRLPEQIVEWTVEAVDRVAREWGQPPTRFYWSPAVKLVVEPGGELLLERMNRTLRQYGVSVEINRVN